MLGEEAAAVVKRGVRDPPKQTETLEAEHCELSTRTVAGLVTPQKKACWILRCEDVRATIQPLHSQQISSHPINQFELASLSVTMGLSSKCSKKPLKDSEQRSGKVPLTFLRDQW